jgi:UDP-N-acetylmuramoyl-tripeptide--D-alanyl-D-alanine ligase
MISFKNVQSFKSFNSIINSQKIASHLFQVTIDSRNVNESFAFIAIKGERVNAFDFIPDVLKSGVKLIIYEIIDEQNAKILQLSQVYKDVTFIGVNSGVSFLQELAHDHRLNFKGCVIGISGSNGKTTTKEMLFHLLNELYPNQVIKTQANNNNHIGVPLTILSIDLNQHLYAVVELGSNHPGEMQVISSILKPDVDIVTNIGETHLEFFDGIKGVLLEEIESAKHLNKNGVYFKNLNDEYISKYQLDVPQITYGTKGSQYPFDCSSHQASIKLNEKKIEIKNSHITGAHNFWNMALAVLVAHYVSKNPIEKYIQAAASFVPTKNRSEWRSVNNVHIFLDAYNANPSSMVASLSGFFSECQPGEKVLVVVGDMNELGQYAEVGHKKVASEIVRHKLNKCVFIGRYYEYFNQVYPQAVHFADVMAYKNTFLSEFNSYQRVFIKGSRSLQLERLLDIK